jgi:hypothetical protein
MGIFKNFIPVILLFSLMTTCADAQNKNSKEINSQPVVETNMKSSETKSDSGVEILAEGAFSKVESPFVFTARSKETYAQLKTLVENLPAESEIDFDKQAVVAAFAGTKNTGGYSVEIKKANGKIAVEILAPPKDAMVTQSLTQPFVVALVSVESENELSLTLSADWTGAMQNYKVISGEFEYSGGFAGRRKQFAVEGAVGVFTLDNLITMVFNLSGKGADKNMKLAETASGTIKDGKIEIARINVGSFSEGPKPPDKVSGMLINDKLSLTFEPLPTYISDGFSARGKIEGLKAN